jgi:FkbM family methyltransferase
MFFDIGSNIGGWTLQNIDKCDKIISIEASPITFTKLAENCKNDKIVLLNYAVSNNNCEDVKFYHAYYDIISTTNKDWLTSESSRFNGNTYTELICKSITIDKLIELYGLPDLIKIDVEGGEYECITSLTQKVNLLCFEWASEVNDITFNCMEYLLTLGYTEFYIQDCDDYTFRPQKGDYYDITSAKTVLSKKIPKQDWGMVWCK